MGKTKPTESQRPSLLTTSFIQFHAYETIRTYRIGTNQFWRGKPKIAKLLFHTFIKHFFKLVIKHSNVVYELLYRTLSNTFSVLFWNISDSFENLFGPFHTYISALSFAKLQSFHLWSCKFHTRHNNSQSRALALKIFWFSNLPTLTILE